MEWNALATVVGIIGGILTIAGVFAGYVFGLGSQRQEILEMNKQILKLEKTSDEERRERLSAVHLLVPKEQYERITRDSVEKLEKLRDTLVEVQKDVAKLLAIHEAKKDQMV